MLYIHTELGSTYTHTHTHSAFCTVLTTREITHSYFFNLYSFQVGLASNGKVSFIARLPISWWINPHFSFILK